MLSQYKPGEQAVLEANPEYDGARKSKSSQVFVKYYSDPAPLRTDVENGQVDVAWRTLSPTDLTSLEDGGKVDVIHGEGSEFRYWVWQLDNDVAKDKATRQAVAQIIDRDAIAENAYDGTVDAGVLHRASGLRWPEGLVQGEVRRARTSTPRSRSSTTPASRRRSSITLGYTPTHYGPNAVDEATELADQLTSSGLFEVKTEDAEWEEYQTLYKEGAYDLFILGWYPDFLDADNYLTPFIRDGGFFANGYTNEEVNKLLDQELGETDEAARNEQIGQLQDIAAEDVPLIPSWVGENVAVASTSMEGVEETLDPTYIFRFWMISKNG